MPPSALTRLVTHGTVRAVLIRSLVISLSIVVSVLIVEIVLRTFAPVYLFSDEYLRVDDSLYVTLRENYSGTVGGDYIATLETNSIGLRTATEVSADPGGVRRILVVGDSYAYGTGVSNGETYSDHLQRLLNRQPTFLRGSPDQYRCDFNIMEPHKIPPDWTTAANPGHVEEIDWLTLAVDAARASGEYGDEEEIAPPISPNELSAAGVATVSRELFETSLGSLDRIIDQYGRASGTSPGVLYTLTAGPETSSQYMWNQISEHAAQRADRFVVEIRGTSPPRQALDAAAQRADRFVVEIRPTPFRWATAAYLDDPAARVLRCYNLHGDGHWSPGGNLLVAWTFAKQIEGRFGQADRNAVFNGALQGWGSIQYAIRLERLIDEVNPDIVILHFTSNDLRDNIEYINRPSRVTSFTLARGGHYFWQVQAISPDGGESAWSPETAFRRSGRSSDHDVAAVSRREPPGVPTPLEPLGGIRTSRPRFVWREVPNASGYRFKLGEYDEAGNVHQIHLVVRTQEPFYELPSAVWAMTRQALRSSQIVRRGLRLYQGWQAARLQQQIDG